MACSGIKNERFARMLWIERIKRNRSWIKPSRSERVEPEYLIEKVLLLRESKSFRNRGCDFFSS